MAACLAICDVRGVVARPRHVSPLMRALQARRRELQWTQEYVEEKVGVTRGLVGKWEVGLKAPSVFMLLCLADVLGVEVAVVPVAPASLVCARRRRTGAASRPS